MMVRSHFLRRTVLYVIWIILVVLIVRHFNKDTPRLKRGPHLDYPFVALVVFVICLYLRALWSRFLFGIGRHGGMPGTIVLDEDRNASFMSPSLRPGKCAFTTSKNTACKKKQVCPSCKGCDSHHIKSNCAYPLSQLKSPLRQRSSKRSKHRHTELEDDFFLNTPDQLKKFTESAVENEAQIKQILGPSHLSNPVNRSRIIREEAELNRQGKSLPPGDDRRELNRMIKLVRGVADRTCAVLAPDDADELSRIVSDYKDTLSDRMCTSLAQFLFHSDPLSLEYRGAAAAGFSCLTDEEIDGLLDIQSKRSINRARGDYREVTEGSGQLKRTRHTKVRVSDEVLRNLILFILDGENTSPIAWKAVKIKLSDSTVEFPYLSRVRPRASMWRGYIKKYPDPQLRVGHTTFFEVTGSITKTQVRSLRAIDYYVTDLLLECRLRIESLIDDVFEDSRSDDKKKLVTHLRVVYKTIQHSHPKWLDMEQSCMDPCSGALFAMGHPDHSCAPDIDANVSAIVRFFKFVLPSAHPELSKYSSLFDLSLEKSVLFMGHSIRVKAQSCRISEIRKSTTIDLILVIGDFMMKFEDMRHREPTTEHYGKRGKSVHGASVLFFRSDGTMFIRHFHTTTENDNTQDVGASLSIFEVIFMNIKKDPCLSNAKKIIVQTDNASNYSSNFFSLFIFHIAVAHGLEIQIVIHNEAQDGKDIVDATFRHLKQHFERFVLELEGHILTSADMATAMAWGGGVKDMHFDVIKLDRERLAELEALFNQIKPRLNQALPSQIAEIRKTEAGHDIYTSSVLPPYAFDKGKIKKVNKYVHQNPFRMDISYFYAMQQALPLKK